MRFIPILNYLLPSSSLSSKRKGREKERIMVLLREFVVAALDERTGLPKALVEVVWDYYSLEKVRAFGITGSGIQLFVQGTVVDTVKIVDSHSGETLRHVGQFEILITSTNRLPTSSTLVPATMSMTVVVSTDYDGFIYYPDLLPSDTRPDRQTVPGVIRNLNLGDSITVDPDRRVGRWTTTSRIIDLYQTIGEVRNYSIFDVNTLTRRCYGIPEGLQHHYESLVLNRFTSVVVSDINAVGDTIYWDSKLGLSRLTICANGDGGGGTITRIDSFPGVGCYPDQKYRPVCSVWNPKTQRIYFIAPHPSPGFYWDLATQQWGTMAPSKTATYYARPSVLDSGIIVIKNYGSEYYDPATDTWAILPKVSTQ